MRSGLIPLVIKKAVRAAAETFRTNPDLDTETAITELGVGEALVSYLDEKGRPNIVERALIRPPFSQIGPIETRERESAYEMLRNELSKLLRPLRFQRKSLEDKDRE
jgi:hypothetical protein